MSFIECCKGQSAFGNACTAGASISKNVLTIAWLPQNLSASVILTSDSREGVMLFRNAKMRRETDQILRKVTFCDGKRGKFFEKSFPAAGKGKNASENGFVRREGV